MVFSPDKGVAGSDWIKRRWDYGSFPNLTALREHLRRTGTTASEFKRLPVYKWNVDKVPWLKEL